MNKLIEPKTLPGFMELSPDKQIVFDRIMNIIKETYQKYGYWPLDTPVIEYSNVLLAKAGGETEKQIYRFNKGDNDLSLRFDLTVPLAKYVSANYNNLVFPFKRYQVGKVYRGERPQKGRFREFYQCDIDVIGDEELSLYYDSEIPSIIYDIFRKLNIGKFKIRINNRKILNGFLNNLGLCDLYNDILRIIDKIDKISIDEIRILLNEIIKDSCKVEKILEFIRIDGSNEEKINILKNLKVEDDNYLEGVKELETVINNLLDKKLDEEYFEIDLTIARGLDYYTGTVYETILVDYPSIGSVCSGGRYDNLAQYYTEKRLPGVGISIGLTRLFYQLNEIGILKEQDNACSNVMILPFDIDNYKYVYDIEKTLLDKNISTCICFTNGKFKSKLKYANRCHVNYIIIVGEDEVINNMITIKNMETGNQISIEYNKFKKNCEKYVEN